MGLDVMNIVDTSHIQRNFRITLVESVRKKMESPDVGDIIGFYEDSQGNIILKKL